MSLVLSLIVLIHCSLAVTANSRNLELLDDYVQLASEVQEWCRASSVFIIFGGNDESLPAMTLMLHLVREFSSKNVLSLTANYTEILNHYSSYYKRIVRPLIVVLLASEDDVASFRDTTRAYDMSYPQWLVIFMDSSIKFCENPKNNIFNLKFDTNMLVKCYGDSTLREWYSCHDGEIDTFELAEWTATMGLRLRTNKTLYERRHSIGGKFLRVATVMDSPFVLSHSYTQSEGLFEKIVQELSKAMNFSYTVIHKELNYGILDSNNKSWSGVIGRIVDGEADIGVAELTMTVQRMAVVDFTLPLILSRNRLYMQPPGGSIVHWSAYSRAFGYEIWLTLGMMHAMAAMLITFMRLNVERKPLPPGHVSENYLAVWGTFCQQGLADFPTATPLRIAYLSLLLSSVIILAIYSACLISYLTLTIPSLPFNDLEGFINDGSFQLVTHFGSADYNMFMWAIDPTLMKMRNLMKDKVDLPKTLMGGFRRACERKKVAFYATEAVKEQLNAWLPCELVSIDTGRFDSLGMVLTKGSPYTGVINYHLQKFKDCGIMTRLKRKYFMNALSPSNEYKPVTQRGILPLVVVLLVGVAASLLFFFIEKCISRIKANKRDARINALKTLTAYEKYVKEHASIDYFK